MVTDFSLPLDAQNDNDLKYAQAKVVLSFNLGNYEIYSIRVHRRLEQFRFFWNPELIDIIDTVKTIYFNKIERDPAVATFKAKAGFDFTLCAFHTKPKGEPLRKELSFLDDIFKKVQEDDSDENDIIFVGDFNAPPEENPATEQMDGIAEMMEVFSENIYFTVSEFQSYCKIWKKV